MANGRVKEPLSQPRSHVRAWTCINQAPQVNDACDASIDDQSPGLDKVDGSTASRYRVPILQAAARIASGQTNLVRKRKGTTTSSNVEKRLRKKVASKDVYLLDGSKLAENDFSKVPTAKQEPTSRPVMNYLLPIKHTRLNGQSIMPVTSKATAIEPIDVSSIESEALAELKNGARITPPSTIAVVSHTLNETTCSGPPLTSKSVGMPSGQQSGVRTVSQEMETHTDDSCLDSLAEQIFSDVEADLLAASPDSVLSDLPFEARPRTPILSSKLALANDESVSTSTARPAPFLRQSSPDSIAPVKYSSIPRLVAPLKIRTCFRIAEAIRALKTHLALQHTSAVVTIELFAIVIAIKAEASVQTFRFADIFFPQRPPYIEGTGRGLGQLLCKEGSGDQTEVIPVGNKICRVIIRSIDARDAPQPQRTQQVDTSSVRSTAKSVSPTIVQVHVEAIRRSDWEEIDYVRGIVDPEGVEAEQQKLKGVPSNVVVSK